MKKFIVTIQTMSRIFKVLILKAESKKDLYPLTRERGVTVATAEYSKHNLLMAELSAKQYNNI